MEGHTEQDKKAANKPWKRQFYQLKGNPINEFIPQPDQSNQENDARERQNFLFSYKRGSLETKDIEGSSPRSHYLKH